MQVVGANVQRALTPCVAPGEYTGPLLVGLPLQDGLVLHASLDPKLLASKSPPVYDRPLVLSGASQTVFVRAYSQQEALLFNGEFAYQLSNGTSTTGTGKAAGGDGLLVYRKTLFGRRRCFETIHIPAHRMEFHRYRDSNRLL